jgi:vacuolar protein sorting-associated protein 35
MCHRFLINFVPLQSCRKVFVYIQEVVVELAKYNAESSVKLSLEAALAADSYSASATAGSTDFSVISLEFFTQAFATYDEKVTEAKVQYRSIVSIAGTLTSLKSISKERYEGFITKTAQCAARIPKKHEQCHLVALCAHLFYPVGANRHEMVYSNPQRALECLQRCLKLADACTTTNPGHVKLFVDILEHYVFFFEKGNPLVTHGYISGLVALIKEHLRTLSGGDALQEAKAHFQEVNRYILRKKEEASTAQLFAPVNLA